VDRALLFGEVEDTEDSLPSSFGSFLKTLAPAVEGLGRWGALLDLKGCDRLHPDRGKFLQQIARRARAEGLGPLSAGGGESRLVARLAAALAPRGCWWEVEGVMAPRFLAPFPLRCLPQGGRKWLKVFRELGLGTLGDLAAFPPDLLREALGEEVLWVWREARGEGSASVHTLRSPGRLREGHAFATPQGDPGWVRSILGVLADRLAVQLRPRGLRTGRLELRIEYHGGKVIRRSRRLRPPAGELMVLREVAWRLWEARPPSRRGVTRCLLTADALEEEAAEVLPFDFARAKADLAPFIARVRGRFGRDAVQWSPELWMDNPAHSKRSP